MTADGGNDDQTTFWRPRPEHIPVCDAKTGWGRPLPWSEEWVPSASVSGRWRAKAEAYQADAGDKARAQVDQGPPIGDRLLARTLLGDCLDIDRPRRTAFNAAKRVMLSSQRQQEACHQDQGPKDD